MNARLRESLRAVGLTSLITLVLIACVSALHLRTRERVARNASLFLQRAVMEVAGGPAAARPAEVAAWFERSVEADPAGSASRFRVFDPQTRETRAWALVRTGRGLWGPITAVIGLSPDRQTFREIRVIDQSETPGLGARITEPWFTAQTAGKSGPFTLVPEGRKSASPAEIDGITGATISASAVRDMLNGVRRDEAPAKEAK
jgi:Na+-transporting NADH:ubiquinone oxidoreductase subunit C